jgi:transposase
LGTKVVICRPRDPEARGLVERLHDYLERSFLPGRSFTSPGDFNTLLSGWLAVVNTRARRALSCAPTERIGADLAGMLALPPVPPVTGWRSATRLPRDHYVRFDSNDYSVHPTVIGRRIEVTADPARVRVFCDGSIVADHERVWARHQTLTLVEHAAAGKALRSARVGVLRPAAEPQVATRALSDYDDALGTTQDRVADGGSA